MGTGPSIVAVHDVDAAELAPYRDLSDRAAARRGGLFIAEGLLVVERLLASGWAVQSVLVEDRRLDRLRASVPETVTLYTAPRAVLSRIVGFRFHRGALACAPRPALPELAEILAAGGHGDDGSAGVIGRVVLVLPQILNTENLGLLLRVAAGFGVGVVLLGPRCCDPFYRQSVRVSMGAVFGLRLIGSEDVEADLRALGEMGFSRIAAVLDGDAQPLSAVSSPGRCALVMGEEDRGLPRPLADLCDRRVRVPMAPGVDSLNVATAAAVFLYHLTQAAV